MKASLTQVKSAGAISIIALSALICFPQLAWASQANCISIDEDTKITVDFDLGSVGPSDSAEVNNGDLVALKMVVHDLTVQPRNQHVATFFAEEGVLENRGGLVVARVDLGNKNSSRRGERIGGTRLGSLESITLEIDFTYREPVQNGLRLAAQVVYTKRNRELLAQEFDCVYSK